MALRIDFNDGAFRVIQGLASLKGDKLMRHLQDKMEFLMTKLQAKIVNEKLSGGVLQRRSGMLAGSITNPRATISGNEVIGTLEWAGGLAWYGRVHEFGGTKTYVINPLGQAGTRKHSKGEVRRFGKDVLRFIAKDGTVAYAKYVFHPPLPKRSFMYSALDDMKQEFRAGLQSAAEEALREISRKQF